MSEILGFRLRQGLQALLINLLQKGCGGGSGKS